MSTSFDNNIHDFDADARPGVVELLYQPGEDTFSNVSQMLVENGWSIFPQHRDGKRMPGSVDGEPIEWSTKHNLANVLPTQQALADWNRCCPTLNVATVFGPASGNTFAVDVDITDAAMSEEVEKMVVDILGPTELRRVGGPPKVALIYRHAPDDVVASTSRHFRDRPGDGLEILGAGRLLTFYGIHHKTRRYFKWNAGHPAMGMTPQDAPLVTAASVRKLMDAVAERFPFAEAAGFAPGGTWSPDLTRAGGAPLRGEWVEEDGIIVDGREKYLTHLAFQSTLGRANDILLANTQGTGAVELVCSEIARGVADIFASTALCNGRWKHSSLFKQAFSKVRRLCRLVCDGTLMARAPRASTRPASRETAGPVAGPAASPSRRRTRMSDDDGSVGDMPVGSDTNHGHATAAAIRPSGNPEFAFLSSERKRLKVDALSHDPNAGLEIPDDRTGIQADINARLNEAISGFFERVYDGIHAAVGGHRVDADATDRRRVEIIRAPTGAGKTSQTIRYIAEDIRTYQDMPTLDEDGNLVHERMPIVMLLPTYGNIGELRQRAALIGLDGSLDDAALRAAAMETGLIAEDEIDIRLADIRRDALACRTPPGAPPLEMMVYSGKIRAGCQMADIVRVAMAAGIGTQGFCQTSSKTETGETERTYCAYYEGCPVQEQRARISRSHVIFMPHNFLSLQLPEELKKVRCVIADERIHHLFLHTATFPIEVLLTGRRLPKLTQADIASDLSAEDLLERRNDACDVVMKAIETGMCPGRALHELLHERPDHTHWGLALIEAGIKVCRSGLRRDTRIVPNMTLADVEDICDQPLGTWLREELQMWEILEDRVRALVHSEMVTLGVERAQAEIEWMAPRGVDERETARHQQLADDIARFRKSVIARGMYDRRIQPVWDNLPPGPGAKGVPAPEGEPVQLMRLSWRSVPNWSDTPTLLLDASASPEVIAKIWSLPPERIVDHNVAEDVGRTLNVRIVGVVDRTYSDTFLTSNPTAEEKDVVRAASNLARVRNAISAVSGLYGDGRVVVGTSIRLRRLVNDSWACPENTDWCHYGAMRGLDCFKNHSAAVSIGRMEVPTRVIDGLAACLTYDDENPEEPFDVHGTGYADEERTTPLRLPDAEQRIRMRDGTTASIMVPMNPGRWGRLMQSQYREEEILQFVGRLRPVYRTGRTPTWFAMSSIIPDGLVVDELIALDDLLPPSSQGLWEALRSSGGLASAEILSQSAPDICPTPSAATGLMMACGLDEQGMAVTSRAGRGFGILKWRLSRDDAWMTVFALASMGEREAAHRLRQKVGLPEVRHPEGEAERLMDVETVFWPVIQAAVARPPDTVDETIGTREERLEAERDRGERIGMYLMDSAAKRVSLEGSTALWELPAGGMPPMTVRQMAAYIAVRPEGNRILARKALFDDMGDMELCVDIPF